MQYRRVLAAAIQTLALFIAAFLIPVIGQVIALFTPVPLIIASAGTGRNEGLTALALATLAATILGGWHAGAVLLLSFGLMAIGVSEGLRRHWRPEATALLGGSLPMVAAAGVTAYFFSRMGKNPLNVLEEYLAGSISEAAQVYTRMGLTEMASAMQSLSARFIHSLVRLIPGITVATSLVQAACCYGLSRAILLKRPDASPALRDASLARWHAPDAWVWGLIASLVLVMLPFEALRFAGWNAAIVFAVVYLSQGAAIVDHYLRKARIQPLIRGLIHAFILALPSVVFVIALGIVDIWADFRKIRSSPQAG